MLIETDERVAAGDDQADAPMQIGCLRNHRARDVVFFRRSERNEHARAWSVVGFADDVGPLAHPTTLMAGRFRLHEL